MLVLTAAPFGPGNPMTPGWPLAPTGPGAPGRPSCPEAPYKVQDEIHESLTALKGFYSLKWILWLIC